jgi:hypothetical protein
MLGVPRNTVERWERGGVRISRPDWLELALARLESGNRRLSNARIDANTLVVRATPQLPAELSNFVGRNAEVAACCGLLAKNRLVTLTGAGGIGKSRLSNEVAKCAADDFPQGVYLVELGSINHPGLVRRQVSTALGIAERAGDSVTDLLIEALRPQKVLLLMDDCDYFVEACGDLAYRLLRGAPGLTILATCREPLTVQGELAWRVPPLETPTPDAGCRGDRTYRRGAVVCPAGAGSRAMVFLDSVKRGRRRLLVSATRRHPARSRVGGGTHEGAEPGATDRPT